MRFFLVGREHGSGTVRIVSDRPFATRQEALDSLSSGGAGDVDLTSSDLFIVDLDASTPIVIMSANAAGAGTPVEAEPIADAWETPDTGFAALMGAAEASAPPQASDEDLAAALRRAALSMEAEGVAPAASVEDVLAPAPEAPEPAAIEPEPVAEIATEPVAEPVAEIPAEPTAEPVAVAPAPLDADSLAGELDALADAATVGAVPAGAAIAQEARPALASEPEPEPEPQIEVEAIAGPDEPVAVPDSLVGAWPWEPEPAAEPSSLTPPAEPSAPIEPIFAAPSEPLVFEPAAVEAQTVEPAADVVADQAPAIAPEPVPAIAPDAFAETAPEPTATFVEAPAPEAPSVGSAAIDEAIASLLQASAPEVKGYEAQPNAIDSYACSDCVYVATCPKADQESPATCGSFQWKSV